MKTSIAFIVVVIMFTCAPMLSGQGKLGIELRGGAAFATTELGDADLKTAPALEGVIDYRFTRYLGAYAGWGWNRFAADRSFAGDNVDFEETGYVLGVQVSSMSEAALGFYVRAGATYKHIEVENDSGNIIADSKHGLGWQVAAGLDLGLGSNWYLRPGVTYQELSRDLTVETSTTSVDLKYFKIGIGIVKRF